MIKIFRNPILSLTCISLFIISCIASNSFAVTTSEQEEDTMTTEKEKVKTVLEKIFQAVGNQNAQALGKLTTNKACIGWTYLKDGVWTTTELSIKEYLQKIEERKDPKPFLESTNGYVISITEGRLATVKAETVISQFGIARSEEVNHIIMIKEKDEWKLLSIAWTVHRIPEEERKFDLNLFARNYAQVWGSNRPEFVAMFFEEEGSLQVNDGDPAIGRTAISKVAQSFMTQFPDMTVLFDSLSYKSNGVVFHWTLSGTDADPNGKGYKVKISGFEFWTMSEENLVKDSKGTFSSEEYERQLEFGIDN